MSAKRIRHAVSAAQSEFVRTFSDLCDRHQSWQVWSDFVTMTATAISNTVDPTDVKEKREKRYMDLISQYTPNEQRVFPELVRMLVDAMEANPDQDFLGDLFMALELGNHWKGQFFTPYNVCKMMAEMQCHDAKAKAEDQGWISVLDPACGAGALLVAARNVFLREGVGFDRVLFAAQDIDHVAGMMCYIQLSLLGCAGYVCIADTLCNPLVGRSPLFPQPKPDQDVWYTPAWYADAWQMRRIWYGLDTWISATAPVAAESQQIEEVAAEPQQDPEPEPEPIPEPEPTPLFGVTKTGQLSLF